MFESHPPRHQTKIVRKTNPGKKPGRALRNAIEAALKASPNLTPAEIKAVLAPKFRRVTTDNVIWVKNNK